VTERINKTSAIQEAGKKKASTPLLKHEKKYRHPDETEEDSIEISDEARERAAGKKQRNILEYINE
jgi:hypothetical protein